jgi:two-component system response regulator HydG
VALRHSLGTEIHSGFLIGASPAFLRTYELLEKVARSQSTVLFLGETGVGKEMFARNLHALSSRRSNAFVAVNCGALPETFELAKGGTIFLDEIGELSASGQVKLLRVLQTGEFERIGDTRTRQADVRIVAATNRNLNDRIQEGRFRADLFFRLSSFPITIPPLRDRRDDILPLAFHFIRKICAREGRPEAGFADEAKKMLLAYDWPGNIRELENVIERSVILSGSDNKIDLSIMTDASFLGPRSGSAATPNKITEADIANRVLDGELTIKQIESTIMDVALERSQGNLSKAARLIGMSRRQLAYRQTSPPRSGKRL